MRTEPLTWCAVIAALALLLPASAQAQSLQVGVAPEATLVGPSIGARAELLVRPGDAEVRSQLRLAAGFLAGLEFHYLPVALGYRATFRRGSDVQPLLGGGIEYQRRWVADGPAANQGAVYGEFGALVRLGPLWLGASGAIDVTFLGGPGAGAALRLHALWDLPGASP